MESIRVGFDLPGSRKAFEELLSLLMKDANEKLKIKLLTIEGLQSIFDDGFGNAMEEFDVKETALRLDFDINNKGLMDKIKEAEELIALKQEEIRKQEIGLKEIQDQEDKINETYDKRLDALDEIEKANDSVSQQQKGQLTLAEALTSGDIAAAARAAQEMRAQEAANNVTKQKEAVEKSRDYELSQVRSKGGKSRVEIEKEIKRLQDGIYEIEQKSLEPNRETLRLNQLALDKAIEGIDVLGRTREQWEKIKNAVDLARISSAKFIKDMEDAINSQQKLKNAYADQKTDTDAIIPVDEKGNKIVTDQKDAIIPIGDEKEIDLSNVRIGDEGDYIMPDNKYKPSTDTKPNVVPKVVPKIVTKEETKPKIVPVETVAQAEARERQARTALIAQYDSDQKKLQDLYLAAFRNRWTTGVIDPKAKAEYEAFQKSFTSKYPKGRPVKLAKGGLINQEKFLSGGYSQGTDTVPAMLTPGEYVLRKSAVDRYGVENLDAMNVGMYHKGGRVGHRHGRNAPETQERPTGYYKDGKLLGPGLNRDGNDAGFDALFNKKNWEKTANFFSLPQIGKTGYDLARYGGPTGMMLARLFGQEMKSSTIDNFIAGLNFLPIPVAKLAKPVVALAKKLFSKNVKVAGNLAPNPTAEVPKTPTTRTGIDVSKLTPEERSFHMAGIDADAIKAIKGVDPSSISVPDAGSSFNPSQANAGLNYLKTGGSEYKPYAEQIWELVQSQRESLLRQKYPNMDFSDVKSFNEAYAQEFYGIGNEESIALFKGVHALNSPQKDWRTGDKDLGTYFSTNPYIAALYATMLGKSKLGEELPMFMTSSMIKDLKNFLGEGAVRNGNAQGSMEFPQVISGSQMAQTSPTPYSLPGYAYPEIFGSAPTSLKQIQDQWPFDFNQPSLITSPTRTSSSILARGNKLDAIATFAQGGIVPKYFADGGFARGTDTIPAMLTPGEFIMSKYAVDAYGLDMMKSINSGQSMGSTVYNNTYTLTVNAKTNSNANEIAREVMSTIKRVDDRRIKGVSLNAR
jgi:hypothetical protein